MYIIMLGAPGTGKGTVGGLLSKELNIPHISSGEIFRNYIKRHTKLGKEIESYVREGKLIPDELAIQLIEKRLEEPDVVNGAILDGFPRTESQAVVLNEFLLKRNLKIDIAIDLSLPDIDIIDRIVKRRTCPNSECREIYNIDFKPPKIDGICDLCGTKLIQRVDDNEETVKQRLKTYHELSEGLIKFYKKQDVLYKVKLNNKSDITTKDIVEDVKKYLENK